MKAQHYHLWWISPVSSRFPSQRDSNVKSVPMSYHYEYCFPKNTHNRHLIARTLMDFLNEGMVMLRNQSHLCDWLTYYIIFITMTSFDRDGVSNHQPHDCLLNRLFRRISKKTSKLRVTGLCEWNSPVTGEFPAQRASNAENASIWWCHHSSIHFICVTCHMIAWYCPWPMIYNDLICASLMRLSHRVAFLWLPDLM